MKHYFFDVDVVLDLLLNRQPYCQLADQVYNTLVSADQKILPVFSFTAPD